MPIMLKIIGIKGYLMVRFSDHASYSDITRLFLTTSSCALLINFEARM